MTWHCLDLFSGLGGFSSAFRDSDKWEVTTVDINEEFDPDIRADVLDLRPGDLPDADVVLAGHPCTLFSTSGNHDEWQDREPVGDRAKEHVAMLYHTLGLIHALSPTYWYLENPRLSRLRWFLGPPDKWVTYCQYGTDYMKPTGLWGDHAPGMMHYKCRRGDPCHDSNTESDGTSAIDSMPRYDHGERSRMPEALSRSILEACEAGLRGEVAEQVTLPGGDA